MKKELKNLILPAVIITIFLASFISFVAAEATSAEQIIGFDPNKIPQTKEEIANQYLSQEWSSIVTKTPLIGPINTFFTNNPLIFNILFNIPYSLTATFFMIFILWLYIALIMSDLLKPLIDKPSISFAIGFASSIILAHINLIKTIVSGPLNLLFAPESWWMRIIMWILLFTIFFVIWYVNKAFAKQIKAGKQKQKQSELEQKTKATSEFIKGVKEGQKL